MGVSAAIRLTMARSIKLCSRLTGDHLPRTTSMKHRPEERPHPDPRDSGRDGGAPGICHPGRGVPQPSPRGSGRGVAMGCSGRIAPPARGSRRAMCRATSTRRSKGTDRCRRSYAAASLRVTAGDDAP